jgi:hypothetical protein
MGLHNEIPRKIKKLGYMQNNKDQGSLVNPEWLRDLEYPKSFYQSLGINLGSTFIVQTDNGIMKIMCVIARSFGYYEENVRDREIT